MHQRHFRFHISYVHHDIIAVKKIVILMISSRCIFTLNCQLVIVLELLVFNYVSCSIDKGMLCSDTLCHLQAVSLTKLGQDSVLNLPSCPLVCRLRTVLFHHDQLSPSAYRHFWSVLTFGMCVSLIQSVLTFVLTLVLSLGQVGGCPKSDFIGL